MRRIRLSLLILSALFASSPALADELGPDGARALVKLKRILPLEQLLKLNEARLSGRIIELELEKCPPSGHFCYKIKVLRPDGRLERLRLDAENGAVLGNK